MVTRKKILIGLTGAIAAYKSIELIRLLREQGNEVRVVLTEAAQSFVTPTTVQAISGHPVSMELFHSDSEAGMPHIDLARWCDSVVVAPASADFLARLTYGHANDLLTTICLATRSPIIVAPSMNRQMWENSITQNNIQLLKARGIHLIEPGVGIQACGEFGPGRMPEPVDLVNFLDRFFSEKRLSGRRFLITAGPTQEFIDPVRFISNRSSGKMGYALAEAAYAAGAEVTVVSGPTALALSPGIKRIDIVHAYQMYESVMEHVKTADVFIAAAAVSDFRVEKSFDHKLKKSGENISLTLVSNPDIVKTVTALPEKPVVVGFCLETENLIENAQLKLHQKNMDVIVANPALSLENDLSEVTLLARDGQTRSFPLQPKSAIAAQIIDFIVNLPATINLWVA